MKFDNYKTDEYEALKASFSNDIMELAEKKNVPPPLLAYVCCQVFVALCLAKKMTPSEFEKGLDAFRSDYANQYEIVKNHRLI